MPTEQEKKYWEGIAKAESEPHAIYNTPEERLDFLDASYEFVLQVKGKVTPSESTATELYYRWKSIKQKNDR